MAVALGSVGVLADEPQDGPTRAMRVPEWFWTRPTPPAPKQKSGSKIPSWFWSSGTSNPKKAQRQQIRLLLFSGADLWRQGAFLYGGSLWAPLGLDRDGLVAKLLTTRGVYLYRAGGLGNAQVFGQMAAITVLPGAHFTRNGVSATIYAGVDRQWHVLIPDDPGNPSRGAHAGLRMAGDIWFEPTGQTMVTASGTLSTIASAYAARLAGGWRLIDSVYVGPEAQVFGAENYRQWRVGVHLTGLTFRALEFQAALGYAADSDSNGGLYARLQVSRKHEANIAELW